MISKLKQTSEGNGIRVLDKKAQQEDWSEKKGGGSEAKTVKGQGRQKG